MSQSPQSTAVTLLRDADVEAAKAGGGVVWAGLWRLHLPAVFGFCGGVLGAVRLLERRMDDSSRHGRVWLLGEIIHNSTVNAHFRAAGAEILPEADIGRIVELAGSGDTVVIPAFGVPIELDRRIRAAFPPDRIVDTTCRYVHRIWTFVAARATAGWTVAIHGKPGHPETRASASRALTADNAIVLVPDLAAAGLLGECWRRQDLARYPQPLLLQADKVRFDRLALANQTTMLHAETLQIRDTLSAAVHEHGGAFEACDTVCRATQDRQDAARSLCAGACSLILVIGGYSSSNTAELYRLAHSCLPTYFISGADALQRDRIRHFDPAQNREIETAKPLPPAGADIGLLAGASCPASDIGAVIRRFRELAPVGAAASTLQ